MNKINIPFIFLILCLLYGCKTQQLGNEDSYEIINSLTKSNIDRKTKIYYKTTSSKYDGTQISQLINENNLQFTLCSESFDRNQANLTNEDVILLKEKFKNLTPRILDNSKIQNFSAFTKNKKNNTVHISEPVKFRNEKFAIYYAEGRYGGEFTLLVKENSEWKKVCSSMVWVE
jgi:hypothetical protein